MRRQRSSKPTSAMLSSLLTGAVLATCGMTAQAQATPSRITEPRGTEIAVTGIAMRSLTAISSQQFWQYGGSASTATRVYRGLAVAVDVAGTHADSAGSAGLPLSLVTVTAGPRYRIGLSERVSAYGQVLFGGAYGFDSLFPKGTALDTSASSFALHAGGGVDFRVSEKISVRPGEAAWVRTQLPNGGSNTQNNLRLGAGVVVRFF